MKQENNKKTLESAPLYSNECTEKLRAIQDKCQMRLISLNDYELFCDTIFMAGIYHYI